MISGRVTVFFQSLFVLLTSVILFSCEQEEIAIKAHESGDVTTTVIELGVDYRYQVFYDLETNTEVSRNLKTAWDLGFEASAEGYHIVLNTSKAMQVYHTNSTNFNNVILVPTDDWKWDLPNGSLEGTAIGEWGDLLLGKVVSKNLVYVIDLGYDYSGNHLGYKKMVIKTLDENGYTLMYADLDGANENQLTIAKDATYNFSFLSFSNNGTVVKIEPPKKDWDLEFTQYTHIFYEDPEPSYYLVTGVLQNRHNTLVEIDSTVNFHSYKVLNLENSLMKKDLDCIGYSWKEYNFGTGTYFIYTYKNYIIKGEQGYYYKLHFIDFYNSSGEKGSPTFEYQRL
jgi:hypothetical protein